MKTEFHIWVGLQPQVYVHFNIIPATKKPLSTNFKSVNDEEAEEISLGLPLGDFSREQPLESTKPKLKVIVDLYPSI